MNICVEESHEGLPISIIHLEGALNGANFEQLIDAARKLHAGGSRDLIIDLAQLTFISSAGLGALHQVALLFGKKKRKGKDVENEDDYRWTAYHEDGTKPSHAPHEHIRLLSPQKTVKDVLDMIGFTPLFEIYSDLQMAVASFPLNQMK